MASKTEELARKVGAPGYGDYAAAEEWADRIDTITIRYPQGLLQGKDAIVRSLNMRPWLPKEATSEERKAQLLELRLERQARHRSKLGTVLIDEDTLRRLAEIGDEETLKNYAAIAEGPDGKGLWIVDSAHEFVVCAGLMAIFVGKDAKGTEQKRLFISLPDASIEIPDGPEKDAVLYLFYKAVSPEARLRRTPAQSLEFVNYLIDNLPRVKQ